VSTKTPQKKKPAPASAPGIVWFEIPADDIPCAKKFDASLFGCKINAMPHMQDYLHMDTGGADASPDGALMKRMHSRHTITNYVSVASVTKAAAKVTKLGGTVCREKTTVPAMGYFAICRDTEGNEFALWEMNPKAK